MMFSYRKFMVLLITVCLPVVGFASTSEQLEAAADNGNASFVLVTEPGATGIDQAKQIIQNCMAQIPGSAMIESNRADAANTTFVQKYKLATAPVPLILVFASNGVMVGGNIASQLSVPRLMAMVPSPKKAEVLMAIQSGQAAYVTASRTEMSSAPEVISMCAMACSQMKGKSVAIDISMDDPAEADFLKQLRVNLQATEPVTVVLNAQGQLTSTFNGPVDVTNLVQAASKKISSGCSPKGCGSKPCGPAPKKEGK